MKECRLCPYIKDEFDEWEDILPMCDDEDIIRICNCEKLGHVINNLTCGEEDIKLVHNESRKPRKFNKYERKERYKKKLEHLADQASGYPSGAYRVGYDGWWTDDKNNTKYIKRCYRGNHGSKRSRHLKTIGNRRVRKQKIVPSKGGYKKVFDFWWELT